MLHSTSAGGVLCPVCKVESNSTKLSSSRITCPVCEGDLFIKPEEFSFVQTRYLPRINKYLTDASDRFIVYVSKKKRYDLHNLKIFDEYRLMRLQGMSDSGNQHSLVSVDNVSINEERFPFKSMPAQLVNSVAPEQFGIFFVYLLQNKPTDSGKKDFDDIVEERHMGYHNTENGRPTVMLIDRANPVHFLYGSYVDYEITVHKVIGNKTIVRSRDKCCNIAWLDVRIIKQLGFSAFGRFRVRVSREEKDMWKGLFSSLSFSFVGDINPLSVAVRTNHSQIAPRVDTNTTGFTGLPDNSNITDDSEYDDYYYGGGNVFSCAGANSSLDESADMYLSAGLSEQLVELQKAEEEFEDIILGMNCLTEQ